MVLIELCQLGLERTLRHVVAQCVCSKTFLDVLVDDCRVLRRCQCKFVQARALDRVFEVQRTHLLRELLRLGLVQVDQLGHLLRGALQLVSLFLVEARELLQLSRHLKLLALLHHLGLAALLFERRGGALEQLVLQARLFSSVLFDLLRNQTQLVNGLAGILNVVVGLCEEAVVDALEDAHTALVALQVADTVVVHSAGSLETCPGVGNGLAQLIRRWLQAQLVQEPSKCLLLATDCLGGLAGLVAAHADAAAGRVEKFVELFLLLGKVVSARILELRRPGVVINKVLAHLGVQCALPAKRQLVTDALVKGQGLDENVARVNPRSRLRVVVDKVALSRLGVNKHLPVGGKRAVVLPLAVVHVHKRVRHGGAPELFAR
eukprot:m.15471 g.15471  ORF g.15471 m.15471 type:complete len:377 (+) comp3439_c0_seq1:1451-2581(+)